MYILTTTDRLKHWCWKWKSFLHGKPAKFNTKHACMLIVATCNLGKTMLQQCDDTRLKKQNSPAVDASRLSDCKVFEWIYFSKSSNLIWDMLQPSSSDLIVICIFASRHACSIPFHCLGRPKVSCRDVIKQAKLTRVKSKGIRALADVDLKRSESGAHRVFKSFGQSVPVRISRCDLPTKKQFPWIKCSDWVKYLVDSDRLDLLVGVRDIEDMQPLLLEFWDRYFDCAPSHEIYQRHMDGLIDVSRTIPILHHGDEGRGYKHLQVMVASTHGLLGNGCRHTDTSSTSASGSRGDPMKLNMIGNTFMTHFIHFLMPVAIYKECPASFLRMLELLSDDYTKLFTEGIRVGRDGKEKIWNCCLACKGDSPYLQKSGQFERSFYRRPLKARSKKPAVGVCHVCLAGVESHSPRFEFEEFGPNPSWLSTEGVMIPFTSPPPFLVIPRELDNPNGERFYKFDLFHNWHLGGGKYFISSSIVLIVQHLISGQSWDLRFQKLTEQFLSFCRREKLPAYYKRLTPEMFGVAQNQASSPTGNWPKGDQTTVLSLFLEDFCEKNIGNDVHDPMFTKIVARLLFCFLLVELL